MQKKVKPGDGREKQRTSFSGPKYEEIDHKISSSTPSCQQICTRFGGKLERGAWMVLVKWQTKRTKKDGGISQHDLVKCPRLKKENLKMKNKRKAVSPLSNLRKTKWKSDGHGTAWIVNMKH